MLVYTCFFTGITYEVWRQDNGQWAGREIGGLQWFCNRNLNASDIRTADSQST